MFASAHLRSAPKPPYFRKNMGLLRAGSENSEKIAVPISGDFDVFSSEIALSISCVDSACETLDIVSSHLRSNIGTTYATSILPIRRPPSGRISPFRRTLGSNGQRAVRKGHCGHPRTPKPPFFGGIGQQWAEARRNPPAQYEKSDFFAVSSLQYEKNRV